MAQPAPWQERLFGQHLVRCCTVTRSREYATVATAPALRDAEFTGVYFCFANIARGDGLVSKLEEFYERINKEARKLEVVQVVLWANNDVYGDFEQSHADSLLDLPWFAMPFSEIESKTRLSRRYRIKSGVTTLVLLDRDGATVSFSAQDRLLEDPMGCSFPWRPRPVDQVLKDIELQPGGAYLQEHPGESKQRYVYAELPEGVKGFYFSANWCPPCRAFTPQLAEVYRLLRKREPGFEIVFVSSDRSAESFAVHLESMPWLAIPWQQIAVRGELAQLYGIRGIPTLLLLDRNGHLVTMDARAELAEDPMAQNFPWKPRAVNILTERFAARLHDYPAIILFVDGEDTEIQFAESVLTPAATAYSKQHNINFNAPQEELSGGDDRFLQFLVGVDSDASDMLRDLVGLDDVVPLLVAVDLPHQRIAVMEYGIEITGESVGAFVEGFQRGDLQFRSIGEAIANSQE